MSREARKPGASRGLEALDSPDGGAAANWADFIDSLHEFRAPTVRLQRASRREPPASGTGSQPEESPTPPPGENAER